jgi:hypothetical protein
MYFEAQTTTGTYKVEDRVEPEAVWTLWSEENYLTFAWNRTPAV